MSKILSAKYYQENKERLQKKAQERYKNIFKEGKEKEKKQQYDQDRYENLLEDEKNKLVEDKDRCYKKRKNDLL